MRTFNKGLLCLSVCLMAYSDLQARKVVCIDTSGEKEYLRYHEVYERRNSGGPGDHFGYATDSLSFAQCLSQLRSGDTLVIIAHGQPGSMNWDGGVWGGFSPPGQLPPNPGTLPLPAGFDTLQNINIRYCSCFSDSAGQSGSSMRDQLDDFLGTGATGGGYRGESEMPAGFGFWVQDTSTRAADSARAFTVLDRNKEWLRVRWDSIRIVANRILRDSGVTNLTLDSLYVDPPIDVAPGTAQNGGCGNPQAISTGCNLANGGDCGITSTVFFYDPLPVTTVPVNARHVLLLIIFGIVGLSIYFIRRIQL